jgi:hypothetical protein
MGFWKKEIASINITQNFLIYGLKSISYQVTFYRYLFGTAVRLTMPDVIMKNEIYKGTEFYVLVILPWTRGKMNDSDLIKHINALKRFSGMPEEKIIDNNVIDLASHPLNK